LDLAAADHAAAGQYRPVGEGSTAYLLPLPSLMLLLLAGVSLGVPLSTGKCL
jgi:hypothetical protein